MVKVIFLENVEDYKVGDIKEVAPGYARNFLFKNNIAKLATEEEVKNLETKIKELQKDEEKRVQEAQKTADKLAKEPVVIKEEVNDEGHLYGSVGAKEIADRLEELGYEEIGGEDIEIEETIKSLGEYEVLVKVGHGVETPVKIKVERAE